MWTCPNMWAGQKNGVGWNIESTVPQKSNPHNLHKEIKNKKLAFVYIGYLPYWLLYDPSKFSYEWIRKVLSIF